MKKTLFVVILIIFLILEIFSFIHINLNDSHNYTIHTLNVGLSIIIGYILYKYLKYQAENYYKKILDAFSNIVFIIDKDGKILYINKQVEKILAYDLEQITGNNFAELIPPNEMVKYLKRLKEVFQNKTINGFETKIYSATKQLIDVEISANLMNDEKKYAVVTINDISHRKKAETKIKQSEKNFRLLFENAPFGIYTATPEGNIIDVNKEALNIIGSPSAEATKKINILEFPPLIENGYADMFRQCLKTGKKIYFDRKYKSLWGKEAIILSQIIPLKNEKGKTVKIYTVMQDISAQKLAEQRLKEQNEEYEKLVIEYQKQNKELIEAKLKADESNRLKSKFLARVSHEIRTPLNAIIGFSELLQMLLTDEKNLAYVDKIMLSGNNLMELINSILDLSKIEAKQLEIKPQKIQLQKIFDEVLLIFSGISKQKQIPVISEINNTLPQQILIDAFRLKQILMNLVGNALKFTKSGQVKLIADYEKTENLQKINLIIKVIDTGIGIPENQLQTIFQSFTQLENQEDLYAGTGLGLAITRQLTELMNGNITVSSKVGTGSTFTVEFQDIEII